MTALFLYSICAAIPLGTPPEPPAKVADDISGIYSYQANDGTADYTGSVVIRKNNERYLLQYSLSAETDKGRALLGYDAVGIVVDGNLSVAWKSGEAVGVAVFRQKGGVLRGGWNALPGSSRVGQEALRFLGPIPE